MDHSEALKTSAAERYLLGELTQAERDAYEEHYFACQTCAEEVRTGAVLVDNAREVFRAPFAPIKPVLSAAPRSSSWFQWLRPAYAMAAIVLLVAGLGYENLVTIPQLRREAGAGAPQTLASFSLVTAGSRGSAEPTFNVKQRAAFGLYFDIPPVRDFPAYKCEVRSESGSSKFAVEISAEQARETVQVLVPGSTLQSGRYELVIRGTLPSDSRDAGQEIARYPFVVKTDQ